MFTAVRGQYFGSLSWLINCSETRDLPRTLHKIFHEVCLMNEDQENGFYQVQRSRNGKMQISHTAVMPNIHDLPPTLKVKFNENNVHTSTLPFIFTLKHFLRTHDNFFFKDYFNETYEKML